MYHPFFGLTEQPFSIAVNPRYLFMSDRHREALAHLLYGVGSGGGFVLLTGEVGTGKTTLNRCLLDQLPANTDIAIVLNPALSATELLASVCDEFEIRYPSETQSLKTLTDALHRFLLANHAEGRQTVLMIDEAQHLDFDVLEQIRLLTNLETDEKKLLQIILTGQPELESMLERPELRQLNQRITARYQLTALDAQETQNYVRHRLSISGLAAGRSLFTPSALKRVFRLTGGIPRLINLLCDRAMMGAYGRNEAVVSAAIVRQAAQEVFGGNASTIVKQPGTVRTGSARRMAVSFGILSAVLAGLLGYEVLVTERVPVSEGGGLVEGPVAEALGSADLAVTPLKTGPEWLVSPRAAESALWSLWRNTPPPSSGCDAPGTAGLRCESADSDTWDAVLELNRPVALDLQRSNRFAAATVLLSVGEEVATVFTGAAVCDVPLTVLADRWQGRFRYFWESPPGWTGPLRIGDRGAVVAHVVGEFARLDGLPAPPLTTFTEALEARVKVFQAGVGLRVDGVIGVRTLQALNDKLGDGLTSSAALRKAIERFGVASCR
jgi:general secretion pathway protein A